MALPSTLVAGVAMIDAPGVYDLPLAEYLADPVIEPSLSASIAHLLDTQSPRHARWHHPRLNPDYVPEVSTALELGTVAHAMVVEHRSDMIEVVDAADFRTKKAQAARDAARARGQIALLPHQCRELEAMVSAWEAQFADLPDRPFREGLPERTFIWREANGVWCRTRPDYVRAKDLLCWDLKSTSTAANPVDWIRRRLFDAGYDIQMAMQLRGARACCGGDPDVRLIVAETEAPYGVSQISLDPESWELAEARVRAAVDTWGRCLRENRWPGYTTRVAYAETPAWIQTQALDRAYYREGQSRA